MNYRHKYHGAKETFADVEHYFNSQKFNLTMFKVRLMITIKKLGTPTESWTLWCRFGRLHTETHFHVWEIR